jgi:hypothetical protein
VTTFKNNFYFIFYTEETEHDRIQAAVKAARVDEERESDAQLEFI